MDTFREQTKTDKQLFLTLITTHGLTWNDHAKELVSNSITLQDLFK